MEIVFGFVPFSTRMVVVRPPSGRLFFWSPIQWNDDLGRQLAELGAVHHLVSPNKIHYPYVADYKKRFPEAHAWSSPGADERARAQGIETAFDRDLDDEVPPDWEGALEHLVSPHVRPLDHAAPLLDEPEEVRESTSARFGPLKC